MEERALGIAFDPGHVSSRRRAQRRAWVGFGGAYIPVMAGLAMWVLGLSAIDIGRMNDLGLISVLPPLVFVAIAIIVSSAGFQLHKDPIDGQALAVHLLALFAVLYVTPVILEGAARTSTVWTHLGLVEYIARTGTTAPNLDARMSWPGFFVGSAFLSSVAGAESLTTIAHWSPVFFSLFFLLPLSLIARALTRDERLVWASLFLFVITDWIGQDYFAPQAVAYFLYLVIVAVFVTWFLVRRPRSDAWLGRLYGIGPVGALLGRAYSFITPDNPDGRALSSRQQVAVIGLMVVMFAFVSLSHQLTPFITVAALLGLLAFNRTTLRTIPILFGVITVAWISYMTVPFLAGHVGSMLSEIGSVGDTLTANVTNRIAGSADHQTVVTARLGFTVALWALAGIGALVRFRDGRRDLTMVLLAAAPFTLVALQGYGGELVLRVYLFSLPFVAIFAAGMVYGRPSGRPSALASGVTVVFACVVTVGFLVARYGNERIDLMTPSEVAAVEELYRTAPPGSLLVAPSYNLPWRSAKVEQYAYVTVDDNKLIGNLGAYVDIMSDPDHEHSYLILTESQRAYSEAFAGLPVGVWDRFVAAATASPAFRVIYQNEDSKILVLADRSPASTLP